MPSFVPEFDSTACTVPSDCPVIKIASFLCGRLLKKTYRGSSCDNKILWTAAFWRKETLAEVRVKRGDIDL